MASGRPNKGMKQTSVEHTERSQLIPGVGRTVGGVMIPAEPTVIAPESAFEAAVIAAVHSILTEAERCYLLVPRFGLDFAVFVESPGGVNVRLVEAKVYMAQRQGGVGFGNQQGLGPQVDILSCADAPAPLLGPTVRWILADSTLPHGTARYACFDCATAKAAAMGGVSKGKQNNLRLQIIQPGYCTWPDLLSQLKGFLLE